MVSNSIGTATTTSKPLYIGFYGAVDSIEQEPVNYSISSKKRNEFASSSNDKGVNVNQLTTNTFDEKARNKVNVKSNILLNDLINRHNKSSDNNTTGPICMSRSNHYNGNNGSSGAIRANSQKREHFSPLIATTLPRTVPRTTTLQAVHGIESKSPLNVRLVRSTSNPKRTNSIGGIVLKKKSDSLGAFDNGMKVNNSTGLNDDFNRLRSILVSNTSAITMKSSERGGHEPSKSSDRIGNGLTMSGLSIHRIDNSIPKASITYPNSQGNRDVNRNGNALEISQSNIKNIGVNGVQIMEMDNIKHNGINKGSMEYQTINNVYNNGYITNREIIKREGQSNSNCRSCSMTGLSLNSCRKSLLWDGNSCRDNICSSSSSQDKLSPVISIIPMATTINMTTNDNTVPNKGTKTSLLEYSINSDEHGHEANMSPLQLATNSVTITQMQGPDIKNTAMKPHQPNPRLLYRASSYGSDDIVQPVMIVSPAPSMGSIGSGVDSALYTEDQKPVFGNPLTITPVKNNILDTLLDDPHPLSLFSTVAANQEYLPTSTITTNSTTNDAIASTQNTSSKIRNINLSDFSEHGSNSDIRRLLTMAAQDESLFSEYMDHESLSLSPPPAGMQRRPKVSYKNLSEGEKNHRLRMLNNEASRLYRHRKQRTIKNLEVEEQQLRAVNNKLRVEFESLQLKRDQAMKILHESLQSCGDCNNRQTLQSGPCSHRITNTSSKIVIDDKQTQLNWSSKMKMKMREVCEIKSETTIDLNRDLSC